MNEFFLRKNYALGFLIEEGGERGIEKALCGGGTFSRLLRNLWTLSP